jgi:xylan 1,4-beta-xylosidase
MLIRRKLLVFPLALLAVVTLPAQQRVTIQVDVSKQTGSFEPVWAWVGHDEPNYTYSNEGHNFFQQ